MESSQLHGALSTIRDRSTQVIADLAALQAVITGLGDPTATLATLTTDLDDLDAIIQASSTWVVRGNSLV